MPRPTDGLKHVDRLPAKRTARTRLRVILEVLQGDRTVANACRTLGICEARFHVLRRQALEGAAAALSPVKTGRPRKRLVIDPREMEALREQNATLQEALWAAEVREELALTMPHVLRRRGKKTRH